MATKDRDAELRKQGKILKQKGLIDKSVDFRKKDALTPSVRKNIKRFQNVLRGEATAVKLPASQVREYSKSKARQVVKPKGQPARVIIEHQPGEKVKVSSGRARIEYPGGISVVQIPCQYHKLDQWFECMRKNESKIDAMKTSKEYFGFTFFGHNSALLFESIDLLIDELEKYESIVNGLEGKMTSRDANEQYRNIVILRVPNRTEWVTPSERKNQRRSYQSERVKYQKRKRRMAANPQLMEKRLKQKAEAERKRRERMTKAEKEEYNKQAAKRAKKRK